MKKRHGLFTFSFLLTFLYISYSYGDNFVSQSKINDTDETNILQEEVMPQSDILKSNISNEEKNFSDQKSVITQQNIICQTSQVNFDIYEGGCFEGQADGEGIAISNTGDKYIGSFKKGKFHGSGKLISFDFGNYEGDFFDGMKHGQGYIYDKNNRVIRLAEFSNDKFIKWLEPYDSYDSYTNDNDNKRHGKRVIDNLFIGNKTKYGIISEINSNTVLIEKRVIGKDGYERVIKVSYPIDFFR